jgi:3-dehydroquinate synthase
MSRQQTIILCKEIGEELTEELMKYDPDRIFVLVDEHTHVFRQPLFKAVPLLSGAISIIIPPGDEHKTINSLLTVWEKMSECSATRHSLLINLGGGMVTDLGGFAAATFKRGIRFINIPTTLLAMVDAAVGGKTGINLHTLKNEVGSFAPADAVLIDTKFLDELDMENILSGYAEMLKHALISPDKKHLAELLNFDFERMDYRQLQQLVGSSITIKEKIVAQDPHEQGIRKALNFGHTVGHAFESFALYKHKPVLHGYAVAWGMVCELYLSSLQLSFSKDILHQVVNFIRKHYGSFYITCDDYDRLFGYMQHDKKNLFGRGINFSLLHDVGEIFIDQTADRETINSMFDFYRECMGFY